MAGSAVSQKNRDDLAGQKETKKKLSFVIFKTSFFFMTLRGRPGADADVLGQILSLF